MIQVVLSTPKGGQLILHFYKGVIRAWHVFSSGEHVLLSHVWVVFHMGLLLKILNRATRLLETHGKSPEVVGE